MRLRSRGPYAPSRKPAEIDWSAVRRESDRARQEAARIDREAREAASAFRTGTDPLSALVARCHSLDVRQDGLDQRLDRLEEQAQHIIDLLRERNAN